MMADVMTPRRLPAARLLDGPLRRTLDDCGRPSSPVAVIDLTDIAATPGSETLERLMSAAAQSTVILIGCCDPEQVVALGPLLTSLCLTLVTGAPDASAPPTCIATPNVVTAADALVTTIDHAPVAATVLAGLLSRTTSTSVPEGLVAESAAYSMLLASAEFANWRAHNPARPDPGPTGPAALLARDGTDLTITLDRPERHNAFSRWVRDAVCEGLDLALADPTISRVTLRGAGPSFCSGGDLDEFGSQTDVAAAHQIRLERSVGLRMHRLAARTVADVHGACIGAGIELAGFADDVRAAPGTWFALPELSMGLIPGAGGTVSLPRRIGRWRAAWLAMSGARLDLDTALDWGLVDQRADT
jgi:Enoyl-CoA hydratase/isomerase